MTTFTPHPRAAHRWAWAGAWLGGLIALLTQAPAQWLADGVMNLTAQRLILQDVQGTVWQGSAQAVLTPGGRVGTTTTGQALATRVQWHIAPTFNDPVAPWGLQARFFTACCTREDLTLTLAPAGWGWQLQVGDHHSQWPAQWLSGLGAPWNTVQPEGSLQLSTRTFSLTQHSGHIQWQGVAELTWQNASTRLSTLRPLGTYEVSLRGVPDNDTLNLSLSTREGALQLQGQGKVQQGQWHFTGEASAAPGAQDALSNLLNVLGQRQGAKSILKLG